MRRPTRTCRSPTLTSRSAARDQANAVVATQTVNNVFSINTTNPIVTALNVNKTQIVASDVGTNFVVQVTYRDFMQTTTNPTIAFSQNVSSTLTFTSGVWNGNGTVYTATYHIGGTNHVIPSINVTVTGALNTAGFLQLPYSATNVFSINTGSNANAIFPVGSARSVTGDFNGDGLSDVAAYYASSGRWIVALSTGTSFLAPIRWYSFSAGTNFSTFEVGDFNKDGKDDIAYFYNAGGSAFWGMLQSTGTAFTAERWDNLSAWGTTGWARHVIGDFNGDGFLDIASFQTTSSVCALGGEHFHRHQLHADALGKSGHHFHWRLDQGGRGRFQRRRQNRYRQLLQRQRRRALVGQPVHRRCLHDHELRQHANLRHLGQSDGRRFQRRRQDRPGQLQLHLEAVVRQSVERQCVHHHAMAGPHAVRHHRVIRRRLQPRRQSGSEHSRSRQRPAHRGSFHGHEFRREHLERSVVNVAQAVHGARGRFQRRRQARPGSLLLRLLDHAIVGQHQQPRQLHNHARALTRVGHAGSVPFVPVFT